ncbi:BQ5605_C002g01000 [Microbotryum silenes-dioicae]|uniref:BQ5605_C002g01000 protein n=1 Tax=Microbotryum silenes-dioicae TaxID=796604 RepID=A0A2X0M212_9BASI|nr:BQ5605_C002g01000 [Microbotryum silenes-dioicae]
MRWRASCSAAEVTVSELSGLVDCLRYFANRSTVSIRVTKQVGVNFMCQFYVPQHKAMCAVAQPSARDSSLRVDTLQTPASSVHGRPALGPKAFRCLGRRDPREKLSANERDASRKNHKEVHLGDRADDSALARAVRVAATEFSRRRLRRTTIACTAQPRETYRTCKSAKNDEKMITRKGSSVMLEVMSSASESDSHNGAGNRLYLKDTKGYKSWASKAYLNLRGDALWDVVIHSVDSLVADYRSTLVSANATASVAPVEPASPALAGSVGRSGSAPSADVLPTLTSVQIADKVAAFRDKADRRNELACKFLANALSEEQMGHCEHLDSAKDTWDTLKGIHSLSQSSRTMDLLSVLMQPYTGDIPFKEFVNTVKITMIDFKNLDAPLPNWLFAAMLVRSLPDQYDSIVGNLASDVDIHMDWNAFYPKLLMNVELAESRNRQKASLSDRIVDDGSLVARISTTAPKDYSKSYCSRCKVHGHERGWRL